MKIVMTYPRYRVGADKWYASIAGAAPEGLEIDIVPFDAFWTWPELDKLWKRRDSRLMRCYQLLIEKASDADILFAWSSGVHPELLPYLPTFNCYFFTDDPEDSPWQSKHFAPAFDAAFYANISSSFQYESWGCGRHSWLPIFTAAEDVPTLAERDKVLTSGRPKPVSFVGGLDDYSSYRRRRLEKYSRDFPEGVFRGRGWLCGPIEAENLTPLYLRTRIGFNIHRTTGPINRRMFQLPAHGVMQLCDNKTGLGQIFELGKQVVGFDTIDEAIELTKYYLEHDAERESIARAGYERFWKDYHAEANWVRLRDQLLEWGVKPSERKPGVKQKLTSRNVSYFFGVARKTLQDEAQRLVRSAKAAKREYLRKDPWWKIYERVFTSEAVYLPEYSEHSAGGAPSDGTERVVGGAEEKEHVPMAGETPALHKSATLTPEEGALRWAMTQLVGGASRIGLFDSKPEFLEKLLSVESHREISLVSNKSFLENKKFDLVMYIDYSEGEIEILEWIQKFACMAPQCLFAFPCRHKTANKICGKSKGWSFGEVYMLLRNHYKQVRLFRMPSAVVPWLEPADFNSSGDYVVALAESL